MDMKFKFIIWNTDKTYTYTPYKFKKINNEGIQGYMNLIRFLRQVRDIYKKNGWVYEEWLDDYYQAQFEMNY